jgi:Na+/melibiose symporter-like transporter
MLDLLQRKFMNEQAASNSDSYASVPPRLPMVLYMAIPVKTCILALYPACFIGMMRAEHWSLAQLALTATFGRAASAFGAVIWGVLVDSKPATALWTATALATLAVGLFGVAIAPTVPFITPFLCLVTSCAGAMTPISQAAAKISMGPEERGTLFGKLQVLSNLGLMVGTGLGLVVGDMFIEHLALPGWRVVYLVSSAISALLTVVALMEVEPELRLLAKDVALARVSEKKERVPSLMERLQALRGRSVLLIMAQGAVASSGSDTLGFVPTWLRYQGLGSWQASGVWCGWYLASSFGSMFSAILSDRLAAWKGTQGRVLVGCYSASVILLLPWLIFLSSHVQTWQYLVLLLVGFHVDMAYVGSARPVLTEVVASEATATAASVRQCVEGCFASCIGNYLIVALAVHMGAGSLLHGGSKGTATEAMYLGHAILYMSTALRLLEVILLCGLFKSEGLRQSQADAEPRPVAAETA